MAILTVPVDEYRQRVQELLLRYAQQASSSPEIETQTIFDTKGDHYQLVTMAGKSIAGFMARSCTSTSKMAKCGFSTTEQSGWWRKNWPRWAFPKSISFWGFTRHLRANSQTLPSIDWSRGLGNGGYGPGVLPQYQLLPEEFRFQVRFAPVTYP